MNKVLIGLVLGVFMCSVPVVEAGKRTREDYEQDQEYMGPVQERDVRSRRVQNQQDQLSQQNEDMADDIVDVVPLQPAASQQIQAVDMSRWQLLRFLGRLAAANPTDENQLSAADRATLQAIVQQHHVGFCTIL